MVTVAVITVLISHLLASYSFWREIRSGKLPSTISFACLSFLLYYDLGLLTELLGYPMDSVFFQSFLYAGGFEFAVGFVVLLLAPWCLRLGHRLLGRQTSQEHSTSALRPGRRKWFYLLCASTIIPLLAIALRYDSSSIWATRTEVGETFGALIVVFYLPLHLLAFYVVQEEARGLKGLIYVLALGTAAVLITWPIGQRTTLLLPFLMIMLFRGRISISRLVALFGTLLLCAALLLPLFKGQYAGGGVGPGELILQTVQADFARAPVLATAVRMSDVVGTQVMPYPGAGYVYSALFFVPRSIAPFKGDSTARFFTADVAGTSVDDTNWGFGVGIVEELSLNLGLLFVLPGLVIYGCVMGLCDKLSKRVPSLVVPSRLAGLWICGYHLPAIILLFGLTAVVGYGLHLCFVAPQKHRSAGPVKGREACTAP